MIFNVLRNDGWAAGADHADHPNCIETPMTAPSSIRPFSALALLPALAMFAIIQACGGSDDAKAEDPADKIEGVWEAVVTATNCSTGAVVGTFIGSQVYHHGGTLSDTNAAPTVTRGPGFGTWVKTGATYTTKFRFYQYDATGVLLGTRRVVRTVTLAADGNSQTAVTTNELFSPAGASLGTGCATDVSNRVL